MTLKFGTGGWRAIIADEFTKANVQRVTLALLMENKDQKPIVIGYDRRFLSDIAAQWATEVIAAQGVKTYFIDQAVPTPATMFAIKNMDINFGMAITASHNPAIYNGIKLFTRGGRDATQEITSQLEINLMEIDQVPSMDFDLALEKGLIEIFNPTNDYVDSILDSIDTQAIRKAALKVLVDPMHGVSKTALTTILATARCDMDIINDRHDTLFGGKLPSPNSATLHKLQDMVKDGKYNLGIATDGDADRIGIVDEKGQFIHPNMLISLLYYYLLKYKGLKGAVVRNISTTHLLDTIAESFKEDAIEVPVGFKHISENMELKDALIGGESSGGLTIRGHISGKDGVFAATLLVEMVAVTGKSLSQLVEELNSIYGKFYSLERDYRFTNEKKKEIMETLFNQKEIPDFNRVIDHISYLDGLKVYFKDKGWISARFSGTEPLIRIFAEGLEETSTQESLDILESFLDITAFEY